jgi:hypothetical protein
MIRNALLLALVVGTACGRAAEPETPAAEPPSPEVTMAIEVSVAIEANPTAIDSVLAAHNLTRPGLDSLMYRIASDSTMSAQYAAGRR